MTQKEYNAVHSATDYISDIIAGCTADENTEEGKRVINDLRETISGLYSLQQKERSRREKAHSKYLVRKYVKKHSKTNLNHEQAKSSIS